jgi:RNA polymerase sigma factor for flagellar operon FliA
MVHECLPQVKRLAGRLAARLPAHLDVRDLVQAGLVGLLDALTKFEPDRGVQFWSYAETRVRGAMLDSLRSLDPLPRSVRRRRREIEQAFSRLEMRLGRAATDTELAEELGIDVSELAKVLNEVRGMEIGLALAEGSDDLIQFVADDNAVDPFVIVERDEMKEHLAKSLEALPEREQLLIALYYHEELTMKEIGKVLHVNESRVSQLHSRAVLRLRGSLAKRLGAVKSAAEVYAARQ